MSSYILRHTDPELWRAVRAQAVVEQISMKALIEGLLSSWLADAKSRVMASKI